MSETDEFDMIETETDWIVRCNKIGMTREEVIELLNLYSRENQKLKSEINMLKVTIGRNEAHIKQLTEKSNWRTSAYD